MITPLHPQTVHAINTLIAPAAQLVVALALLGVVAAWAYRFRLWLKHRRDDVEPSEFTHEWERHRGR